MLSCLLTVMASVGASGLEAGQRIQYRGTIAERVVDAAIAEPQAKTFQLSWFVAETDASATKLFWFVEERGRGAWPWPERFGQLILDAQGRVQGAGGPSLYYDYGEGESAVPLPPPLVAADGPLAIGAKWKQAGLDHEVLAEETTLDRPTWRVQVGNSYGVKRTVQIDKAAPLLVALNERVFMNKGTEFALEMKLAAVERAAASQCAATHAAFASLLLLREKLHRPPQSADVEWNAEQIAILSSALPELEKQAAGGPLEKLVAAATRDVALQGGRADEVADLVARYLGEPLPDISLPGLAGGTLSKEDLAGQVTVLHFWDYRDEPLKEPYGQVGYLEFLHHKRKDQKVKIYGVAVDSRLNDDAERRAVLTGVRKLKAFMNLTYPLVLDGGAAIKALGDPRIVGATLPLVVVVGRDGRVAHYHVGYYEVDRQEGLKELDAAVGEALKK